MIIKIEHLAFATATVVCPSSYAGQMTHNVKVSNGLGWDFIALKIANVWAGVVP